jgi:hypothetical protein
VSKLPIVSHYGSRIMIDVAKELAADLQAHLLSHGIPTAIIKGGNPVVHLEVISVGHESVKAVLRKFDRKP